MLRLACTNPNCRRRYRVPDGMASRAITCPACGGTLGPVPPLAALAAGSANGETSGRVDPPSLSLRDLTGEAPAPTDSADARLSERLRFECEHCHAVNLAAVRMAGEAVRCPKCRKTTRVSPFLVAAPTGAASPRAGGETAPAESVARISLAKITAAAETKHDTEQKLRWRSDQRVRRETPQPAAPGAPSQGALTTSGAPESHSSSAETDSVAASPPVGTPVADAFPPVAAPSEGASATSVLAGGTGRDEGELEEASPSADIARSVRERASETRRLAEAQVAAMELAVARAERIARQQADTAGWRGVLPPAPPPRRAPLTPEQIDALERSSPCDESPHPADLVRRLAQGNFPRSRWNVPLPMLFATPFRASVEEGLCGAKGEPLGDDPLASIDAAVYANSPFRALRLPADAGGDEIAARRQGGEAPKGDSVIAASWSVGYERLVSGLAEETNCERLNDPAQRLTCELFWPHASGDPAWPLALTGRLASWHVAQAFRRTAHARSGRARVLALHGAAVAFHCLAISAECGYALGIAPWNDTYWRFAAEAWEEVLDCHDFWAYLVERGDPRINSATLVARMRRVLPGVLLGFHALFAQAYARGGDDLACQRQLALGRLWPKSLSLSPHALTAAAASAYR